MKNSADASEVCRPKRTNIHDFKTPRQRRAGRWGVPAACLSAALVLFVCVAGLRAGEKDRPSTAAPVRELGPKFLSPFARLCEKELTESLGKMLAAQPEVYGGISVRKVTLTGEQIGREIRLSGHVTYGYAKFSEDVELRGVTDIPDEAWQGKLRLEGQPYPVKLLARRGKGHPDQPALPPLAVPSALELAFVTAGSHRSLYASMERDGFALKRYPDVGCSIWMPEGWSEETKATEGADDNSRFVSLRDPHSEAVFTAMLFRSLSPEQMQDAARWCIEKRSPLFKSGAFKETTGKDGSRIFEGECAGPDGSTGRKQHARIEIKVLPKTNAAYITEFWAGTDNWAEAWKRGRLVRVMPHAGWAPPAGEGRTFYLRAACSLKVPNGWREIEDVEISRDDLRAGNAVAQKMGRSMSVEDYATFLEKTQTIILMPPSGKGLYVMTVVRCATAQELAIASLAYGGPLDDHRRSNPTPGDMRVSKSDDEFYTDFDGEVYLNADRGTPGSGRVKYHLRAVLRTFEKSKMLYFCQLCAPPDEWESLLSSGGALMDPGLMTGRANGQ